MTDDLLHLPLTPRTVHLCIDMQRIFSSDGPWATPWMELFGANGSAGWRGSGVGGGGASILMPSPSIRGLVEFCAAATAAHEKGC
jgi:hypothetical protein